jgi:hypothetical protein
MALFPTSPTNGQTTVVNGITYTYNSAQTAWVRTGAAPTGDLTVVGNITATGNVSGAFILGNGSQLTGIVATTATTAGTVTTNAQPNITSVGTLTGLTVGNATANAVFGNGTITLNSGLITGNGNGLSSLQAANVTGTLPTSVTNAISNVGTITAGTWNSTFTAGLNANTLANIQGANVSGAVASATAATNASALLQNTSTATSVFPTFSTSSANGNSSAVVSTGISANLGNNSITATTFVGALSGNATTAGTVITAAQPNITSVGTLTSLGVSGAVTASTLTSNIATGTAPLVVSSNTLVANLNADLLDGFNTATANTANTVAVRDTNGNLSANFFIGNGSQLTGIITSVSNVSNGNSNLNIPAANGNINLSVAGNANVLIVTGTGANITGTANVTGNLSAGNITTGSGTGGNISGANVITANTFSGNLSGNATTAGTVVTNAQPNITSVGTLTSLGVNGTVTAVAFTANTGVFTGNANGISSVQAGNIVGTTLGATVVTSSLTTVGTLGSLNVTANVAAGNLTTTGVLSVTGTGVSSIAGNLDMTGNTIINLATPSSATDAATKQYVDDVAQGLNVHDSCYAATANTLAILTGGTIAYNNGTSGVGANLTLGGTPTKGFLTANTFDGNTTAVATNRILVKNEANAVLNGIYTVTSNTVLTRATDYDSVPEVEAGDFVFITDGDLYNDTGWVQTSTVTAIGTAGNNITFTQFSGAGTYTAGTGLTLTGSQFSVNASQTQITSVGTLGSLAVTANANVGNLNAATAVIASTLTSNVATGTAPLTVTSTTRVANLNVAYANVSDLTNVTAPGTGTGYVVFANATSGNVAEWVSAGISSNLANNSITATTFVGALSGNATTAGTVVTAAQPNITSVGTLTSLGVSGAVTASTLTSNVATGTAPLTVTSTTQVANLNAATAGFATDSGTVLRNTSSSTTAYPMFTTNSSNGYLPTFFNTGISSNLANASITATTFVGALSGNATTAGTVITAAQPNITSVTTSGGSFTVGNISNGGIFMNRGEFVFNSFSGASEGGQLVLGWAGASGITGQANSTWNMDVDASNNFRLFYQNATGTTGVALSANSTSNIITTIGNISAPYFIGNGSLLTGISGGGGASISNGTSSVSIPTTDGNVNIIVGSTATMNVTTTGANITGTANISGNASANNLFITSIANVGNSSTADIKINVTGSTETVIRTLGTTNSTEARFGVSGANAQIVTISNHGMNFGTNSATRMTILAGPDGNVGIANTNPAHTLSVTGTTNISGNANVGNLGAGTLVVSNRISQTGTVTDASGYISFGGQLNSTQTGQQNMFTMQSQVSPQAGATLGTLNGLLFLPTIVSSANNITSIQGINARVDSLASYTGAVDAIYTYSASTPSWSGTTAPFNVFQYTAFDATATSIVRGFWSQISSGSNKWNFYASGTANNYMSGNLGIGTTDPTAKLTVTGTANISGNVTAGNLTTSGANGTVLSNNLTVSGAATGNANVVGTVTGNLGLRAISATYTDNSAAATTTIANAAIHGIGIPTLAAANATVTSTNAATFFIEGPPTAGTNMTITNAYALHVESGNALFAGNILGRLANGNSSVNMPAANGNINLTAVGNTTLIVTGTGANIFGTLNTGTGNANVGNLGTTGLIATGNTSFSVAAGNSIALTATAPPTVDMFTITNTGQNVATAGVSAMQINYIGGTGAIEASAVRADMTPGTTSGSTWNAYRVAATAAAVSGVTFNGIKFDDKTAGAGTSRAVYVGTNYDEILNYNGTIVINGNGTINGAQVGNLGTANAVVIGNGTSIVTSVSPGTAGNVLTSNGTNWVSQVGGGGGGASIANGTSNVNIATVNGNITMGVTGVANVVVVSNTDVSISEVATVTAPGLYGKTMMISTQYLSV